MLSISSTVPKLNHPALDLMADGETTLCVLPMFHIFAMNVTMSNMLLNGGRLVTLPSFDPGYLFFFCDFKGSCKKYKRKER